MAFFIQKLKNKLYVIGAIENSIFSSTYKVINLASTLYSNWNLMYVRYVLMHCPYPSSLLQYMQVSIPTCIHTCSICRQNTLRGERIFYLYT